MSKMLQSRLDNEPTPATWDNIISILDGPLKKKLLAIEICQFLVNESGILLTYYYNNNYTYYILHVIVYEAEAFVVGSLHFTF